MVEGEELEADWSGHTEDKYDFEKTFVADLTTYSRAFIEVSAKNNAHIALSEEKSKHSKMYEICFGDR